MSAAGTAGTTARAATIARTGERNERRPVTGPPRTGPDRSAPAHSSCDRPPAIPEAARAVNADRRRRAANRGKVGELEAERVEVVHELVEVVLRAQGLPVLPPGDADRHADRRPAVGDELAVALLDGRGQGVLDLAPEQLGQVDLEAANRPDRGPGDGRGLVLGEHDRLLGAD